MAWVLPLKKTLCIPYACLGFVKDYMIIYERVAVFHPCFLPFVNPKTHVETHVESPSGL
jgi:hypothetical protein